MKTPDRIALLMILLGALLFACGREGPGPPPESPDTTPPRVQSTIPAAAATNVPLNSVISVNFSETMNAATVNDRTITLTRGGSPVPGSVTYSGTSATYLLQSSLDANTLYTLTVSIGVRDASGIPLTVPYQCVFMTGARADSTAPTVISSEPAGSAVPIYSTVSVVFSEPVNPSTITPDTYRVRAGGQDLPGTVTLDSPGTKAIYLPSAPFSYNTNVAVTIASGAAGVKDLAGNALATDVSWSFRTAVKPPNPTYTLTVTRSGTGDGLITADTGSLVWYGSTGVASYDAGTTVILNAGASEGSSFAGWTGCASVIGTACRVDMGAARAVSATFTLNTYSIIADSGPNGSISPSGQVSVNYGASRVFTIKADSGYHVLDVLVDTVSAGAVTNYTFTNVTRNHAISAIFSINTYTITASAGANGSISPSGSVSVSQGVSQEFTITAAAGYHIDALVVDGVVSTSATGTEQTFTFNNVTADHTISASFAINSSTFTISASAGAHGSISPSGPISVSQGGSQSFTITPDDGYSVDDVLVDGSSAGPVLTHTFDNVTMDHTISASFAGTIP